MLGLGTHAPVFSLDRPGLALSTKGYAYAWMPETYLFTHTPAGANPLDREFRLEVVQRPFLSDILPKLSSDDQRELARAIAWMLADVAPLNGRAEDFARFERVVPPGFDRYFFYWVGVMAMDQHPHELPKAVAAVEFLRHRSAAAHHLALIGIYQSWSWTAEAALDFNSALVVGSPTRVAPDFEPHYWRALGRLTGQYWYDNDQSLSHFNAHLQAFVPRLDPTVQRSFLQGVGQADRKSVV